MNDNMRRHIHNLKKSAGLPGNGSVRYEYILTNNQLMDSYLKRMNDLEYPLRVEPKRDRYVMNKQALEKAFNQAYTQALTEFEEDVTKFVEEQVMSMIQQETMDLLNTVTVQNGKFTTN